MPIIKRYPNRKLYNTQTKQYISLQGIAELIYQGEEVQVIDHATSEDVSALTLTQILLELEKRHSGFLSHTILTYLIRAGNDRLSTLQRYLASQIGFSHPVDELLSEIEHILEKLNIPTRDDLEAIMTQLDRLSAEMETLSKA